jgi:hypothetical protein
MKPRLVAFLALVASCGILSSPHVAFADAEKEADLLKRIDQLEKRVTELEKVVKEGRPSGKESATETEKKLVGNWVIVDADKKTAADKKLGDSTFGLGVWTDMKMNADGTCAVVKDDGMAHHGKYQMTVTQIALRGPNPNQSEREILWWEGRVTSVTEKELVLEYKSGDEWVKLHYTRMK